MLRNATFALKVQCYVVPL